MLRLLVLGILMVPSSSAFTQAKFVCFLNSSPSTSQIEHINPFLCSHLIYSYRPHFISNRTGIPVEDRVNLENFTSLKLVNPTLKNFISIQYSKELIDIASSKDNLEEFTLRCVFLLRMFSLDGVDITWTEPNDPKVFTLLLKELNLAFERDYEDFGKTRLILSASVLPDEKFLKEITSTDPFHNYTAFTNLMAYNLTTRPGAHFAPIYPSYVASYQEEQNSNVDSYVTRLISLGISPENVTLGIPTFGLVYNTTIGSPKWLNPYTTICKEIKEWTINMVNKTASGPLARNRWSWMSFDDQNSAKLKGRYAAQRKLGGLAFFTYDQDDFKSECKGVSNPIIKHALAGFKEKFNVSEVAKEAALRIGEGADTTPAMKPALSSEGTNQEVPMLILTQPFRNSILDQNLNSSTTEPSQTYKNDNVITFNLRDNVIFQVINFYKNKTV